PIDVVQKMICASWREKRVLPMESAALEVEMARQTGAIDTEFTAIGGPGRQVLALFGTTDAPTVSSATCKATAATESRRQSSNHKPYPRPAPAVAKHKITKRTQAPHPSRWSGSLTLCPVTPTTRP